MSPKCSRWLIGSTGASYLLALLIATGLHDHKWHDCCRSHAGSLYQCRAAASSRETCRTNHGGNSHRHCPASRDREHPHAPVPPAAPLHDDDCAFCQFVAQKPLSTSLTAVVLVSQPVVDFFPVAISAPPTIAVGISHSRAPPVRRLLTNRTATLQDAAACLSMSG